VPADLDVHLILDNYATHKTPAVKRWLLRTIPPALHPDRRQLAQPRRTVLQRDHQQAHPTRSPPQRRRAGERHPGMAGRVERTATPVRVDQDHRRDPRQPRRVLQTNQRLRTLAPGPLSPGCTLALSTRSLFAACRGRASVPPRPRGGYRCRRCASRSEQAELTGPRSAGSIVICAADGDHGYGRRDGSGSGWTTRSSRGRTAWRGSGPWSIAVLPGASPSTTGPPPAPEPKISSERFIGYPARGTSPCAALASFSKRSIDVITSLANIRHCVRCASLSTSGRPWASGALYWESPVSRVLQ
jgi:hypothetical protein